MMNTRTIQTTFRKLALSVTLAVGAGCAFGQSAGFRHSGTWLVTGVNIGDHVATFMEGAGREGERAALDLFASLQRPKLGDPQVKANVEAEMSALLKRVNAGIADYEKLQMLVLVTQPWTIENGSLTPTMKIKRSRIEADVAGKIESWYAAKGPVIWA